MARSEGQEGSSENPLLAHDGRTWDSLIEAAGPASLLVALEFRMSAELRARLAPEDVLQETLLHAWKDRARCQWHGVPAFRRWLLAIAENRLRDLADRELAQKRGGCRASIPLGGNSGAESRDGESDHFAGPVTTTTPSRVAMESEKAACMRAALESLAPEQRAVLRLRLFEDLTLDEVAARLDIGVEAARHRFRAGAEAYHRRLAGVLEERHAPTRKLDAPRHGLLS